MGIDTARGDWEVQFAYWLQARSHTRALYGQMPQNGYLMGKPGRAFSELPTIHSERSVT